MHEHITAPWAGTARLWTWQPQVGGQIPARPARQPPPLLHRPPPLPPVFTNVHWPRATQKMLSGKTAAMMQWVLCWHLALIRQQSTGLKPRGGRLRDPPALSSSEVQNKGNLKKATMEHRTHSPHKSCCKLSIKNGSVIIMEFLALVLGTSVWLALPLKSTRITDLQGMVWWDVCFTCFSENRGKYSNSHWE